MSKTNTIFIHKWLQNRYFISLSKHQMCFVKGKWHIHDFDAAYYKTLREAIRDLKSVHKCRKIKRASYLGIICYETNDDIPILRR